MGNLAVSVYTRDLGAQLFGSAVALNIGVPGFCLGVACSLYWNPVPSGTDYARRWFLFL